MGKPEKRIKWYTLFMPLLLIVISGIVHGFVGNPVSKIIAGRTFDNYIAEKYPGCYYEDHMYDFTCNGYTAVIYSHTNPDIRIVAHTDTLGLKVVRDNYEDAVLLGENTARRLGKEYTAVIESILGNEICGYKVYKISGVFADNYVTGEQYSLKSGPLVPGKEYDIYEISPTDGDIALRIIAPGATETTAKEILLYAKQKLEENGIVFDTISLSIGENADCWPHIVTIEKVPYSLFADADFDRKIQQMSFYKNPQWVVAFHSVTDRYIDMLQSAEWYKAQNFDYNGVFVGFYLTPECSQKAMGYNLYVSADGLEIKDIDTVNYEKYTDSEVAALGTKAAHIAFNVHSANRDPRAAADIMNEINSILAEKGYGYAVADLEISDSNFRDYHYYVDIPFKTEKFTAEEMESYMK